MNEDGGNCWRAERIVRNGLRKASCLFFEHAEKELPSSGTATYK